MLLPSSEQALVIFKAPFERVLAECKCLNDHIVLQN